MVANDHVVIEFDKAISCHKQFFECTACGKIYWEGGHPKALGSLGSNLDAGLLCDLQHNHIHARYSSASKVKIF